MYFDEILLTSISLFIWCDEIDLASVLLFMYFDEILLKSISLFTWCEEIVLASHLLFVYFDDMFLPRCSLFRYFDVMRRANYVTPTSYLELIKTFKNLLGKKRLEILILINRYSVGLEKLRFSENQVIVSPCLVYSL